MGQRLKMVAESARAGFLELSLNYGARSGTTQCLSPFLIEADSRIFLTNFDVYVIIYSRQIVSVEN